MNKVFTFVSTTLGLLEASALKSVVDKLRSRVWVHHHRSQQKCKANSVLQVVSLGIRSGDICSLELGGVFASQELSVLKTVLASAVFTPAITIQNCSDYIQIACIQPEEEIVSTSQLFTLVTKSLEQQRAIIDHEQVTKQLLSRESVSSTALPLGIALPHICHELVQRSQLVCIQLSSPLSWDSQLSNVKVIFLLLLSKSASRRQVLAFIRLSKALCDDQLVQRLLQSTDDNKLIISVNNICYYELAD